MSTCTGIVRKILADATSAMTANDPKQIFRTIKNHSVEWLETKNKDYLACNAVIVASSLDDGLSAGTVVLAFGLKALIRASNRLLGLSAGTVALQLVLHRLLIVASNCCDGVAVVLDAVVDELLLPPPQEARRTVRKAIKKRDRLSFICIFNIYKSN
jgi:hypothetical protein